jgi:hypothetical protein
VEQRLAKILTAGGATGFTFKRVPSNYYERSFEERRDLLGATSIDHLCKSIVMVRHKTCNETACATFKLPELFVSGNWLLLLEKGKLSIFCILMEKKKQKPQLGKIPGKNPGFFLTGKHSSRCKCEGLQRSKKLKVLCHRCTGKTT